MYVGILIESFSLDMCFSTSNGNLSLSADEKSSLSFLECRNFFCGIPTCSERFPLCSSLGYLPPESRF